MSDRRSVYGRNSARDLSANRRMHAELERIAREEAERQVMRAQQALREAAFAAFRNAPTPGECVVSEMNAQYGYDIRRGDLVLQRALDAERAAYNAVFRSR